MEQQKPSRAKRRSAKSPQESSEFFRKLNESYGELKKDPKAWAQEIAERKLFDNAVSDGLRPGI